MDLKSKIVSWREKRMKSFSYVIKDEIGIHARPAGLLAKTAKEFNSQIIININGKSADITRLMAVMALGIKCGNEVEVTVEGDDEEAAFEAIKKAFEENL